MDYRLKKNSTVKQIHEAEIFNFTPSFENNATETTKSISSIKIEIPSKK